MQIKKPRALPTPITLMMLIIIVAALSVGQYGKLANNDNHNLILYHQTIPKHFR